MTDRSGNVTPVCCTKMNCSKNEKDNLMKVGGLGTKSELSRSDNPEKHFDILSVVSEECLSNVSEGQQTNHIDNRINGELDQYSVVIPSEINMDYQTIIPPLKHFEDISYKDVGPNIGKSFVLN